MPHIKTYAQVDETSRRAAFLALTSANLSKAAWGTLNKAKDKLYIMSFEAGVLLLPKFVNKNGSLEHFDLGGEDSNVILPYDLPLIKYDDSDSPWFMDYLESYLS